MKDKILYVYDIWVTCNDTIYYNDISELNLKCVNYNIKFEGLKNDDVKNRYIESLNTTCNQNQDIKECVNKIYNKYFDFFGIITAPQIVSIPISNNNIQAPQQIKVTNNEVNIVNKKSRYISETIKKQVAGRQKYKCANNGLNEIVGLLGYKCPNWTGINNGSFDESGYDIDHIEEFSLTQNNEMSNLQALCKACHSVKTRRFMTKY